jgi:hypothetical protein
MAFSTQVLILLSSFITVTAKPMWEDSDTELVFGSGGTPMQVDLEA